MPWPIRLGPQPRMMTASLPSARAPPRSPRRRRSSGRASGPRTPRRRCRPSCTPGGCRAPGVRRGPRPRAMPRISAICASEKPCRLARRSSRGSSSARPRVVGDLVDQHQLVDEPRVDPGGLEDLLGGGAGPDASITVRAGRRSGCAIFVSSSALVARRRREVEDRALALQRAQRLLQRLGEVAADGHRLADALHVRGQRRVGPGELLEREPRHLHHDVVERRLEGGRGLLGDVVADLVEGVADGDLRGDLGDREAGRLRGQRTRPRDARVHLDHDQPAVRGVRRRTGCCSRRCRHRRRG